MKTVLRNDLCPIHGVTAVRIPELPEWGLSYDHSYPQITHTHTHKYTHIHCVLT